MAVVSLLYISFLATIGEVREYTESTQHTYGSSFSVLPGPGKGSMPRLYNILWKIAAFSKF